MPSTTKPHMLMHVTFHGYKEEAFLGSYLGQTPYDTSRRGFLPTLTGGGWKQSSSPRNTVGSSAFNQVDRKTPQQQKLNLASLRKQAKRSTTENRLPPGLLAASLSESLSRTTSIQLSVNSSAPALLDRHGSGRLPALPGRNGRGGSEFSKKSTTHSLDKSPTKLPVVAPPRPRRIGLSGSLDTEDSFADSPHGQSFGSIGLASTGSVEAAAEKRARLPSIVGVGDKPRRPSDPGAIAAARGRRLSMAGDLRGKTVPNLGGDSTGSSPEKRKATATLEGGKQRTDSVSSFASASSAGSNGSEFSDVVPVGRGQCHRMSTSRMSVGSAAGAYHSKRRAAYKSMMMSAVKHHSQAKAVAVFEGLQSGTDHEMLRELLPGALRELGYREVSMEWVEEIATSLVGNMSFLNLTEFGKFLDGYNLKRLDALRAAFPKISKTGASRVSFEEVAEHLESEGIVTVPGILIELLKENNSDGIVPSMVNINEYIHLREVFMYRAGFTESESEAMRNLFDRYDDDGSGTMDSDELTSAVRWLGFSLQGGSDDIPDLAELTAGLNINEDGCDFEDFLQVVKHYREKEILTARGMFRRVTRLSTKSKDEKSHKHVDVEGAVEILLALGYISSSTALIHDACEERGLQQVDRLDFNDFYMMLSGLRKREGFLRSEFEDFRQAFNAHDVDGSGAVDVVELGGALRWLGYPVTVEVQQELMYDVDVDRSGEIDFDEFLKIMRWYKEGEFQNLQRAFKAGDLDGNGTLDHREVRHLLPALGYYPLDPAQDTVVKKYLKKGAIDFRQCADMIGDLRAETRKTFRATCGFTRAELVQLKEKFHRYDQENKGYIGRKELRGLLSEAFPEATETREGQEKVAALLSRIDADGNGNLEWSEYLHLMRQVQDRQDWKWVLHEQETAKKAGFTPNEVRDLRRVFKICDADESHTLNADEVIRMLTTIISLDHKMREKVRSIIAEVDTDGNHVLSFTEFLLLMHQVQRANIYDIHAEEQTAKDKEDLKRRRSTMKSLSRHGIEEEEKHERVTVVAMQEAVESLEYEVEVGNDSNNSSQDLRGMSNPDGNKDSEE
mmetsp:Transcript_28634/g.65990  ORF Transcript_28634/g.65990 Transcript_28634/m.65990 type:complete len:1070 (+) Transcript_28634:58-3267(+)